MNLLFILALAAGIGFLSAIPFTHEEWAVLRPAVPVAFAFGVIFTVAGGPGFQVTIASGVVVAAVTAAAVFFIQGHAVSLKHRGKQ